GDGPGISSTTAGARPMPRAAIRARSISCPSSPRSAPPAPAPRVAASMPAQPTVPSPWTPMNGADRRTPSIGGFGLQLDVVFDAHLLDQAELGLDELDAVHLAVENFPQMVARDRI